MSGESPATSARRPGGGLMVCGTTSDAGKTTVVAGLCRVLARRGATVAPFKAQNMALNSAVTASGHEIARAQALQADAARVPAEVAMNPILLKPTSERTSQVVVMGEPWKVMTPLEYHESKPVLFDLVRGVLADLRRRFDVVVCEGAGSPAEINLLEHDIVNLRLAVAAEIPAIVVGDINLGGVFASLFGTVELLPPDQRACVRGFVVNKLRGDPALLLDGPAMLEARTGVPTIGVLPWLDLAGFDAEDSMVLERPVRSSGEPVADLLDVAVVRLPRISNFTDFDALAAEAGVSIRYVQSSGALGSPDMIVVPGSKSTVTDLAWLRSSGLADAIAASDTTVVGVCAGYQMMGATIDDPVESRHGIVDGLGWLPVDTTFEESKVTRVVRGRAFDEQVVGYQIHHGRVRAYAGDPFVVLDEGGGHTLVDGVGRGRFYGTTVHGVFDADRFRRTFLAHVAQRRGKRFISAGVDLAAARDAQIDRIADAIEQHVDVATIESWISTSARSGG